MFNSNKALQRHCIFSMEIGDATETFMKIYELLQVQQIIIDELHMTRISDTESKLVFHMHLEKDRIRSLQVRFGRMKKIYKLECLHDYQRNKLY